MFIVLMDDTLQIVVVADISDAANRNGDDGVDEIELHSVCPS